MNAFTEEMMRYKKARQLLRPFLDMAVKFEVVGTEKIPKKGGFFVVANHRSDLDPLIISSVMDRYIAWIAASFTFKIPIVGDLLKDLGVIPISNQKKDQINALKTISRLIKSERVVGIFPEGEDYITENDWSKRIGEFQTGFAHFAYKMKADVLPVSIVGVKERSEVIPVPAFVRKFMGMPDKVLNVKNRLMYKQVKVVIGDLLPINRYLKLNQDQAIQKLVEDSKKTILEGIMQYGEIERRKDRNRQSGTRISEEEKAEYQKKTT